MLAKVHHNKEGVGATVYPVQLLDSFLHIGLTNGSLKVNMFAGGIGEAHFIRKAETDDLWVHLTFENSVIVQNRSMLANIAVYDDNGNLCIYYGGCYTQRQAVEQDYQLCTQVWQDVRQALPRHNHLEDIQSTGCGWGLKENHRMTAILHHRLQTVLADAKYVDGASHGLVEKAQEALQRLSAAAEGMEASPEDVPTFKGIDLKVLMEAMAGKILGKEDVQIPEVNPSALLGLAENKPIESHRLAAILHTSIKQVSNGNDAPRVIRIMEVAEMGCHLVLDELCAQDDLPSGVVVEYFVASHDANVVKALSSQPPKLPPGLVLRYMLWSGGSKLLEMGDMTLDALILNDWPRCGSGAWLVSDEEHPIDNMVETLRRAFSPQARVFFRGFGASSPWASALCELLGLQEHKEQQDNDLQQVIQTNQQTLAVHGEVTAWPCGNGAVTILECQMPGMICYQPTRMLVVTDTVQMGDDFQRAILGYQPEGGSVFDTLCLNADNDNMDPEELQKALEATTTDGPNSNMPLTAIVFLAGVSDSSVVGEVAFQRLLKLCNALNKIAPSIQKLNSKDVSNGQTVTALWIVTEGVNFGNIRPSQASIQGFVSSIAREMNPIFVVKHLDMSSVSSEDLTKAAELVLSRPREMTYGIDKGQLKVPRFQRVDHEAILTTTVLPSDTTKRYCAEPDRTAKGIGLNERFVVFPMADPADDEIQVEVHATGVFFTSMV